MRRISRWFAAMALTGALGFWGAPARAQTESVLHTFSSKKHGRYPQAALIMDQKGNLYGTTTQGGKVNMNNPYGSGVVFRLSPPYGLHNRTVIYTFSGGKDGGTPFAGLIMDKQGNLYGTATSGGVSGAGVVFKLSPPYGQGHEKVLYNFTGGADGGDPFAGVIMDSQGNLYGTTDSGGGSNVLNGYGVVFKLSPPYGQSNETVLYAFSGGADGSSPESGVIMDKQGNLYGTTPFGGAGQGVNGSGVVFKLSPPYGQSSETVLYTFTGGADGAIPTAALIEDPQGNLYGTTVAGGNLETNGGIGSGVVFKLSPPYGQSSETVLYTFNGGADGGNPYAGVITDAQGNLYGATEGGGSNGNGVVFKLDPSGTETVLYTFTGGADGGYLDAGLLLDPQGNLFGVTAEGGKGYGVVFEITP